MIKYSKYKYVSFSKDHERRNKPAWLAQLSINGRQWCKHCNSERTAALQVDLKLIENGNKPVNILSKK